MTNVKEISQELLNRLFDSNIVPRIQLVQDETFNDTYSTDELKEIRSISDCRKAIVGIDIYRYSKMPTERQMFIPHLFDRIYEETWHLIKQNYVFLFQPYGGILEMERDKYIDHRALYISTGDGGFQILETPIHAIVFILTFATILRLYNSDLFMRKLHAKIGNIDVRYVVTWDEIYKYRENYYGSAIINNSRILSVDRLNRLLIDDNTYNWFLTRIVGIENLMTIELSELTTVREFSNYNQSKISEFNNALIKGDKPEPSKEGIKSIDIQRVGSISQKGTSLEVHNLHIQAVIHYRNLFEMEKVITVSVGNLNVAGIENEET